MISAFESCLKFFKVKILLEAYIYYVKVCPNAIMYDCSNLMCNHITGL